MHLQYRYNTIHNSSQRHIDKINTKKRLISNGQASFSSYKVLNSGMYNVLELSRSSYYYELNKVEATPKKDPFTDDVIRVFKANRKCYTIDA